LPHAPTAIRLNTSRKTCTSPLCRTIPPDSRTRSSQQL
jgi:hypothetical protein